MDPNGPKFDQREARKRANFGHVRALCAASRKIQRTSAHREFSGGARSSQTAEWARPAGSRLHARRCYSRSMTIKARVTAGRLVVDEPTDLPEGSELELLPLDPGDWLDDAARAALHEVLRQSEADVAAGRLVDASEILDALRSR